ncbi:MAG: type I restriction endonuclease subunit R [Chitinispirillaceae bacterium]|nr:type I restriction endonuclease subunit R [Chitinispirillaceae bacterium]
MRVAFLIDEAHRSQEGSMGAGIRLPFRSPDDPDIEDATDTISTDEEKIASIIRQYNLNQLFVAFTATPAPATLTLFGHPFDSYTEAEAISEGYIVDVASSIISFKTLYHLHCPVVPVPDQETEYPKGVVAKALKNVAFQDEGLIQYKAEVMLRIFEQDVAPLIGGRAKAMIVASSRVAGLRYFEIIREKLRERGAPYAALYAFSDFIHPETEQPVSEHAANGLNEGEQIEERFEQDDYRLLVVANKFQTGFDQPLLAGMFLDKPVTGRNAIQTVSRLNRCHPGKNGVIVVDFTNNAADIIKAFTKYRRGTPFTPDEPDSDLSIRLYHEILATEGFKENDISRMAELIATGNDARAQFMVNALRIRFLSAFTSMTARKNVVRLLARYARAYRFQTCFFSFPEQYGRCAIFAEYVGPQLIKQGPVSDLMKLVRATDVIKASVRYQGEVRNTGGTPLQRSSGRTGVAPPQTRVSVQDMIDEIQRTYAISDEEALFIKEVTREKMADDSIRETVHLHRNDRLFLDGTYRGQVNGKIQERYSDHGRFNELADVKYTDTGGIFDIMAMTVISTHLTEAA